MLCKGKIFSAVETRSVETPDDAEIIGRVLAGDCSAYELLLRRYNQRVYRAIRCIATDAVEAEDILQETWVRAYQHLHQFAGRAAFSTWLIRIAVHEALLRVKRLRAQVAIPVSDSLNPGSKLGRSLTSLGHPEAQAMRSEIRRILERALETLPEAYRTVFVLREVEELSTSDTARCLGLTEEAVKTRLHRSRAFLRRELAGYGADGLATIYQFLGESCDRMVRNVMRRVFLATDRRAVAGGI